MFCTAGSKAAEGMDVTCVGVFVYGVDCGLCDWLIARVGLSYRVVDVCILVQKS